MTAREKLIDSIVNGRFDWKKRFGKISKYEDITITVDKTGGYDYIVECSGNPFTFEIFVSFSLHKVLIKDFNPNCVETTLDYKGDEQSIKDKLIDSIINGHFQWQGRQDKETKYRGMDIVVQGIKCGRHNVGYRVFQLYGTWSVEVYFTPRVVCIFESFLHHPKSLKIVEYKGK